MADAGLIAQLATSVVVGLGSGIVGARAAERASTRRYEREREDARIPALRDVMYVYRSLGSFLTHQTRSGPPQERLVEVEAAFRPHRHDLPLDLQRRFDEDYDDDPFSYGDHLLYLATHLEGYLNAVLVKREGSRRRGWRRQARPIEKP